MFPVAFVDERKHIQLVLLYFLNGDYDQGNDEAQPKEDPFYFFPSMLINLILMDNEVVSHHCNYDRVKGYNVLA